MTTEKITTMWTTKKELQTAIKLSVESKTEKFPAFIELGPCQRGADVFADRPDKTALDALERVAHANEQLSRWFGKCEMRACCAAYETRFLFQEELAETIRVSYQGFKQAVSGLDRRDVELKVQNGVLYLWQGRDCVRLQEMLLSEEQEAALPHFARADEDVVRCLNGYELAGTAEILKQLIGLPGKTQCGEIMDAVYFENRAGADGYEDLIISANNYSVLGFGRQNLDNWGGLGIFLLPANAARKIVHAQKLLSPAGADVSLGARSAVFDFGRFELRTRLLERETINPDIAVARDVKAVFEFSRAQLLAFAKKAKIFGHNVLFSYERGSFAAAAGTDYARVDGRMENGARQKPAVDDFTFSLAADDLAGVLKSAEAARVELCFGGNENPVWLRAGGLRYAFIPRKEENKNGK